MAGAITEVKNINEYMDRVRELVKEFDALGHGARQEASFDLRVPPSRVSGILLIREVNEDILAKLEGWVAAKKHVA